MSGRGGAGGGAGEEGADAGWRTHSVRGATMVDEQGGQLSPPLRGVLYSPSDITLGLESERGGAGRCSAGVRKLVNCDLNTESIT